MVNVEQITSTLAKLPDQALQRYAMMHKDDPYIMSLAISESKRRKEMRSAGQGMQGMQPQPKVVDQAVAAMVEQPAQPMPSMPEEQGIGALPAAQQMNFADGGITGYAGGGDIFSQFDQQKADRLTQLNNQLAAVEPQLRAAASSGDPAAIQLYSQQAQELRNQIGAAKQEAGNRISNIERLAAPAVTTPPLSAGVQQPQSAPVSRPTEQKTPKQMEAMLSQSKGQLPPPDKDAAYRAGQSVARTPAAPAMSIEDRFLASQKKLTEQQNPNQAKEDEIQAEGLKLAKDKLASVDARQAMFKDAFGGREARLEERAKELEKSKDTNTGLAFLEAGLAIMSTPGGLATAIGKGAREGTAKYASGIEKLRSAKDKLDEAKDRMEELKLNRDEMSAKERAEAELGIQQTVLSGKKDALSSAKTLYGERSTLSQKIVESTLGIEEKAKDRANATQNAGIAQSIAQKPQADFIADWLKKPENAGKTFSDAYIAFRAAGAPATAGRGVMTRDQASDNVAKALEPGIDRKRTIEDATSALAAMGNAKPTLAEIKEHLIQEQMRGAGVAGPVAGATTPSSGKVPQPPSGYRLN